MKPLIAKLKPSSGISGVAHVALNIMLPLLVYVLVKIDFVQLAVGLVLLSKWRMLAVRPRFWPANIRANSIDVIVGLATVVYILHSADHQWLQLLWTSFYMIWLLFIKPSSSSLMVSLQAMIGLLLGLGALFAHLGNSALSWLVLISALICYFSARHFFDSFDEPFVKLLSYLWAYFAAGLVWVQGHWLLFYGQVAQPTLLLVAIGYGLAALYYLENSDRLSKLIRTEVLITTYAVAVAAAISLTVNVTNTVKALLR